VLVAKQRNNENGHREFDLPVAYFFGGGAGFKMYWEQSEVYRLTWNIWYATAVQPGYSRCNSATCVRRG